MVTGEGWLWYAIHQTLDSGNNYNVAMPQLGPPRPYKRKLMVMAGSYYPYRIQANHIDLRIMFEVNDEPQFETVWSSHCGAVGPSARGSMNWYSENEGLFWWSDLRVHFSDHQPAIEMKNDGRSSTTALIVNFTNGAGNLFLLICYNSQRATLVTTQCGKKNRLCDKLKKLFGQRDKAAAQPSWPFSSLFKARDGY